MKIIFILAPILFKLAASKEPNKVIHRHSFRERVPLPATNVNIEPIAIQNYGDVYTQEYSTDNLKNFDGFYQIISNSLEKPVQESQEYIPSQQSLGPAVIPQYPPLATPVNAAASNVPSNENAVFLGSGSIGVVNLGGGAYVLGSGSLGYSEIRRNPRTSLLMPTLPPIQAHPSLLPAAVNSPEITQPKPIFSYSYPQGQSFPNDPNEYEFLTPDQVGFGDPLPPRRLKITNAYAVPTSLQIQPQVPPPPSPTLPPLFTFAQITTLPPIRSTYNKRNPSFYRSVQHKK
ncbi:uncharacterized protein LOC126885118 isoform X2 [Diabrotica virgifera virgifera]|uniref:Uncharacterized protein n=1 Tax=Diabrotica virgifera virgifera TaxID=50390 RepID=A0ABM5KBE5_DIAVI|nr:uncharacterized protein LOC126885118 isoform X2 [Diabrotica virgifera virgifera]